MQHLIRRQCFLAQSGYALKHRNDFFFTISSEVTNILRVFDSFQEEMLLVTIDQWREVRNPMDIYLLCVWICIYCKAWSYKYLTWLILLTWAPACMNKVTHMHTCLQDWAPKSIKLMVEIYKIYNWWTSELGFCSKVGRKDYHSGKLSLHWLFLIDRFV